MKTVYYFVVLLGLMACKTNSRKVIDSGDFKHASFEIDKPIDSIHFKEKFMLNLKHDTLLILESGSFIQIPANAFVNKKGELVETVDLVFEEYANSYEIMMSGIPMVMVENGDTQQFQSAGMCQIEAYNGEEKLELQKDKSIKVGMRNNFSDPNYNLYFFDEEKNVWQEKAKNLVVMNQENILVVPATQVIDEDEIIHIQIENNAERPFLNMWDNSRFKLIKGQKLRHEKDTVWWYDMSIQETKRAGVFTLIFQGLKNQKQYREKILVQPLINPQYENEAKKEFQLKMKTYAQQLIAYQELIDKNEKEGLEILKQINEQRFKDSVEAVNKYITDSIYYASIQRANEQIVQEQEQLLNTNSEVIRVFNVNRMGIYNCDRFFTPKYKEPRRVSFTKNGETFRPDFAYLVNPFQNAILNVSYYDYQKYSFNLTTDDWYYIAIGNQNIYSKSISLMSLTKGINTVELNETSAQELEVLLR